MNTNPLSINLRYTGAMILSAKKIQKCIQERVINIHPFNIENLKPASYSFTLAGDLTLKPEEFAVVETAEKITLPADICCFLSTRGSIAQQGIDALQSSTFVEPLSNNHLKIEIKNNSKLAVTIAAGTPIVKAVFMKVG